MHSIIIEEHRELVQLLQLVEEIIIIRFGVLAVLDLLEQPCHGVFEVVDQLRVLFVVERASL